MRDLTRFALPLACILIAALATGTTAAPPQTAKLQQEAAALRAKQQAAEKSLAELRKQLKALVDALRKSRAAKAGAQKTVKDSAATLKKQQAAVNAANTANQKAAAALAAAQKALAAAQKAAAAAKTKADAAAKALAGAQKSLKGTQSTVAKATATAKSADAAIQKSQASVNAFLPKVTGAQAAAAKLAADVLAREKAAEELLRKQGKFVSFSDQIAPIFARRCLACHNARTAKGRFNMESFASILKGGESGAAVEQGKPGDSTLYQYVEDGSMPKDADPLTKKQIALIKAWIANGARLNAGISPTAQLAAIAPKPPQPVPPKSYRVPIPVTAVAFSPDGKSLVSSGYHEILFWKPGDGSLVRRISNIAERVYDVAFSPDGKTLAVAAGTPGQLGEAKLFNVADGKLLADFFTTDDSVFAVAFSPDGKRLAAAGADRGIRVFDVATGKQLVLIEDHADWVMGIAWSPDGKKLASASRDKTSKVFDVSERTVDPLDVALGNRPKNLLSGESLATFNGHGQPVFDVAFSPDGKAVITSGADKQVRVWNPANAKQIRAIGGFGDQVFRISVTKDGRVFSSSADKTARVHTWANGKAIRTFGPHADWVYAIAYSPATRRVATGSYNGEVRIFNEADGKQITAFVAAPGQASTVASAKK